MHELELDSMCASTPTHEARSIGLRGGVGHKHINACAIQTKDKKAIAGNLIITLRLCSEYREKPNRNELNEDICLYRNRILKLNNN